jgi:hypothetical protein
MQSGGGDAVFEWRSSYLPRKYYKEKRAIHMHEIPRLPMPPRELRPRIARDRYEAGRPTGSRQLGGFGEGDFGAVAEGVEDAGKET